MLSHMCIVSCANIHTCTLEPTHMYTCVYKLYYTDIGTFTLLHACAHMHAYTHTHAHVHTHTQKPTHAHMPICTLSHIHTCTQMHTQDARLCLHTLSGTPLQSTALTNTGCSLGLPFHTCFGCLKQGSECIERPGKQPCRRSVQELMSAGIQVDAEMHRNAMLHLLVKHDDI